MNQQKPVVEFPVSTVRDQQPVDLLLQFDTPKEIDKGDWMLYLYGVVHEGVEKVMFAYSGLYNKIQASGAVKGDTISVVRIGQGKDNTQWDVLVQGQPTHKTAAQVAQPRQTPSQQARSSEMKQHLQQAIQQLTKQQVKDFMKQQFDLIALAWELVDEEKGAIAEISAEDMRPIAISLVISAQHKFGNQLLSLSETMDRTAEAVDSASQGISHYNFIEAVSHYDDLVAGIIQEIQLQNNAAFSSRNEVVRFLKDVGLSSRDIVADDQDTWVLFYDVACEYAGAMSKGLSVSDALDLAKKKASIQAIVF